MMSCDLLDLYCPPAPPRIPLTDIFTFSALKCFLFFLDKWGETSQQFEGIEETRRAASSAERQASKTLCRIFQRGQNTTHMSKHLQTTSNDGGKKKERREEAALFISFPPTAVFQTLPQIKSLSCVSYDLLLFVSGLSGSFVWRFVLCTMRSLHQSPPSKKKKGCDEFKRPISVSKSSA